MKKKWDNEIKQRQYEINDEDNKLFLQVYLEDLMESKMKPDTIMDYLDKADFFLNDFLNEETAIPMQYGHVNLDYFFRKWLTDTKMWLEESEYKRYILSLNKFYKTMYDHDYIDQKNYEKFRKEMMDKRKDWERFIQAYIFLNS